jgi:GT2 family glycosyltransferase
MADVNKSTLAWTGERMVPHHSDAATELYHWQRYLFFKPWYEKAKVVDAASGEGYGTSFAGVYAEKATGVEIDAEAVAHGNKKYDHCQFVQSDVTTYDYSDADLVLSFETIEHVPDPVAFLKALKTCKGRIVISTPNRKTHSPGNKLEDKPLNPFHTIEWTPVEFAKIVEEVFEGRQVRFLSQEQRWPGRIVEGLDDDAMYCIAVIGDGELPKWPRIGMAIPTINNFGQLQETILSYSKFYPGEIEFAVVANGTNKEHLEQIKKLESAIPYMLHVIEEEKNLGYGAGCNLGLDYLWQEGYFDYFAVSNDDVIALPGTLVEMVGAFQELTKQELNPGVLGPVTNRISGAQQVDIGEFHDRASMFDKGMIYHLKNANGATRRDQLRGLLFLISPDCLSDVGGFDLRFGWGNFEDDDHNLRCKLAGYSLWSVDGAFLYHHGSQTFQNLNIDYAANIERNMQCFGWKWDLVNTEDWPLLEEAPEGVSLFEPLSKRPQHEFSVTVQGGERIDLITQASDIEFVAWVHERLKARHRDIRRDIVKVIMDAVQPAVSEAVQAEQTPEESTAA